MLTHLTAIWKKSRRIIGGLTRAIKLVWASVPLFAIGVLGMTVINGLIPMVHLWIAKLIVDDVVNLVHNKVGSPGSIFHLVILYIGISALEQSVEPALNLLQGLTKERLVAHINLKIMEKACALPGLSFFENPKFYDKIQTVQQESAWRPAELLFQSTKTLHTLIVIGSMLFLLGRLHLFIPFLLLATSLPYFIFQTRLQGILYEDTIIRASDRRRMRYVSQVLLNNEYAKEVRLFGIGSYFLNIYRKSFEKIYRHITALKKKKLGYGTGLGLLSAIGAGASYFYVVLRAISGQVTIGDLTLFSGAVWQAQQYLLYAVSDLMISYECHLYISQLFELLDIEPRISVSEGAKAVQKPISQGLEFKNVRFRYPGTQRDVLRNISFVLRPGETLAIVGRNGAGKTTIVKLLLRFYDPTDGEILFDGVDLREYNIESYREQIGAIFQDFAKYQLTAKENIGLGNVKNINDLNLIRQSAKRSGADAVIGRLPYGYDTILSKQFEGGVELSGGEWNKVAIARAFIRSAQILIMDEPTAALDAEAEYELYHSFTELAADKTVLLISHRFSTVRMADRIIVLDNGHIIEEGSHEKLIAQAGYYAKLFNMQAERYR